MGQIRPVVITVTPIEIISSCTCVTEEIICPHVLSSPCVSMQVQAQRLGCRGETSCTVWNKLSFHHTGFMSTWWKESVRTTSISCCSFQCPGGSWQTWNTYQKQFRVAAPLSSYEKRPACPPLLRPLLGDPPLFFSWLEGQCLNIRFWHQLCCRQLSSWAECSLLTKQTNVQGTHSPNHWPEDMFTESPGGYTLLLHKSEWTFVSI